MYQTVFENWNQSGQNDPKSFHNYCHNNLVVQYAHMLFEYYDCELFRTTLSKVIQGAQTTDESSSSLSNSDGF